MGRSSKATIEEIRSTVVISASALKRNPGDLAYMIWNVAFSWLADLSFQ